MSDRKRRRIYEALGGPQRGSYQEFERLMSDPQRREAAYRYLSGRYRDIGDYATFERDLGKERPSAEGQAGAEESPIS